VSGFTAKNHNHKRTKDTKDLRCSVGAVRRCFEPKARLIDFLSAIILSMAGKNPKSEIRNPKSKRLVPLLLDWFSKHARDLPWRRTRDPYAIWVSEIMLQQTQVKTVIPFWERWMRELPTIDATAKASSAKIHKLWEGLGYYTRVRNLQKAAQQIVTQHDARLVTGRRRGDESQTKNKLETPHVVSYKFPEKFDDVLALPGIGRYTAGAICSIAFNQPTPLLDGNVIRVLTRVFGIAKNPKEKKTNAQLWQLAEELVRHAGKVAQASRLRRQADSPPYFKNSCSFLNQSLMELGALICTPRNPQCLICPVKKLCLAFKTNRVEGLPNLGKREITTARHFIAFVVENKGRFLVRQRPAGVVNAHLWEFPNVEVNGSQNSAKETFQSEFGFAPERFLLLITFKHSITRYRITLKAFLVSSGDFSKKVDGSWKTSAQLKQLAFNAAHKKLASAAVQSILFDR
jgi:A/G-specific adenine glycosylase